MPSHTLHLFRDTTYFVWCAPVLLFKSISFRVDELFNFYSDRFYEVMESKSMIILLV